MYVCRFKSPKSTADLGARFIPQQPRNLKFKAGKNTARSEYPSNFVDYLGKITLIRLQ